MQQNSMSMGHKILLKIVMCHLHGGGDNISINETG